MRGTGIINLKEEAKFQYETSCEATGQLRSRIVEQSEEPVDFESSTKLIRSKKNQQQGYYEKIYRDIQPTLSSIERKALEIATSHAPCLFLVDYSTVEGGAFRTQQT